MIYRFNYTEAVLEFKENKGRTFIEAPDPTAAIGIARDLFRHTREEKARKLKSGQYLVNFKVSLDYQLPLLRQVERAIKMLRCREIYTCARYIDRYIVSTFCMETGKPEWLAGEEIRKEIGALRKAAVVAREVSNVRDFVDWDIAIYNYLELNSREGYHSRVIRKGRKPQHTETS